MWADYFSIAQAHNTLLIHAHGCKYALIQPFQAHRAAQGMAIAALPSYSASSDFFVVIAPEALHKNTNTQCDVQSYAARGWCRAELMSYVSAHGMRNMWVLTGCAKNYEMRPVSLDEINMRVFQGETLSSM